MKILTIIIISLAASFAHADILYTPSASNTYVVQFGSNCDYGYLDTYYPGNSRATPINRSISGLLGTHKSVNCDSIPIGSDVLVGVGTVASLTKQTPTRPSFHPGAENNGSLPSGTVIRVLNYSGFYYGGVIYATVEVVE